MNHMVCAVVAATLVLPLAAGAQTQPDFTGTWKMDPERRTAASHSTAFPQITLTIKQTADAITIDTRSSDASRGSVSTDSLTYKLDGSESSIPVNSGEPIKTKAYWDGDKLIAETIRTIQSVPVTTRYVFSLNTSGQELTIEKALTVQHGYRSQVPRNVGTGKEVYVRVKQPSGH